MDKVSIMTRDYILHKTLSILEEGDFLDILLPCLNEACEKYKKLFT